MRLARLRRMPVDRTQFLLFAAALATSTGCDTRSTAPAPAPAAPTTTAASAAAPTSPIAVDVVPATTAAPACDDSQGTAEECPSVGPSDEGVCPNVINKRCSDFKAAMKPRVAAQAVSCLRALKGNDRCDLARINQCGHVALMSACSEPPRPLKGSYEPPTATKPALVTLTADTSADPSPVAAACANILRSCGEKSLNPTLADCRQTLAGFNDTGRANMVDCVSAHCSDKGLYGCEAQPRAVAVGAAASP